METTSFGGASWARTWLQGDSHVYNMGAFKHQGEDVCFGFDDFDDSLVADYQYDIWRFTVALCWTAGIVISTTQKRLSPRRI